MSHAISEAESLFERLGGQAAVDTAVDLFYRKVMDDESLARFFVGVDMGRQRLKQKAFMTYAFGGPSRYEGKSMAAAHAPLLEKGLNDSHFDAVAGHLQATLDELNIPVELSAEVMDIVASTRDAVLGRES